MKIAPEVGHIYVVGEVGDDFGPVKIGIHSGPPKKTGRPGLNAGNARKLTALAHLPVAIEDMRWQEWLIHRRLRRHHVRCEWFDIRDLNRSGDWLQFLGSVIDGTGQDLHPFTLGQGDHVLVRVRQVPDSRRHFIARCSSCGDLDRGPKESLPTVLKAFARHAGVQDGHEQLTELTVETHHGGFTLNEAAKPTDSLSSSDFSADWWKSHGYEGRQQLLAMDRKLAPNCPGIYVVTRATSTDPQFLSESCGGHFKGRNPTVEQDVLRRKWIEGVETVYIGKATNLRRRIGSMSSFGRGKAVGHWGGRYLWQLADADQLVVSWKATDGDPRLTERDLIAGFEMTFGQKPFANIAS